MGRLWGPDDGMERSRQTHLIVKVYEAELTQQCL